MSNNKKPLKERLYELIGGNYAAVLVPAMDKLLTADKSIKNAVRHFIFDTAVMKFDEGYSAYIRQNKEYFPKHLESATCDVFGSTMTYKDLFDLFARAFVDPAFVPNDCRDKLKTHLEEEIAEARHRREIDKILEGN